MKREKRERGALRRDDPESPVDYTLLKEYDSVWIGVDSIAVNVHRTDEGVVVDLYPNGREIEEPLASTYAFFSEAEDLDGAEKILDRIAPSKKRKKR